MSFEQLIDWPADLLDRARQRLGAMANITEFMQNGISISTDYSGFNSPREAMHQLRAACKLHRDEVPEVRFTRACDNAKLPQQLLLWSAAHLDKNRSCVFDDIECALSEHAKNYLNALEPPLMDKAPSEEDIAAAHKAYTEMQLWLMRNRSWIFPNKPTGTCLVHRDCECPQPPNLGVGHDGPLRFNWAGTVCHAWSSAGAQLRYAHRSERTHAVWLTKRIVSLERDEEDGFFQECTWNYPVVEKLQYPTQGWCRTVWVKFGPDTLGFPSRRPRVMSFAMSRNKLVWLAPATPAEIQADFEEFFARAVVLDGDSYLAASQELVQNMYTARLAKRHHFNAHEDIACDNRRVLQHALCPGYCQTLKAYQEAYEARHCSLPRPAYIVDLEQSSE